MKTKKRGHFLAILNRIISLLIFEGILVFLIIKLLSYDINLTSRILYFQVPALFFISLITIGYTIYIVGNYFTTFVTIDDKCITLETSFLLKKTTIVPYQNIHLYTTKQSFIYKKLGIKRFLINSGSSNEKTEIDITLSQKDVEIIETKVCESCTQNNNSDDVLVIKNKWLFLYSILIPSKWLKPVGYTLSVLTLIAISLTNNQTFSIGTWALLYGIAILISIGLNILYMFNKYYSFSLKKISNTLLVAFGKAVKTNHFIDIERINGVLIKQDFIGKITKTYHPFLYIAGFKNTREELSLPLFPIAHKEYLNNLLQRFLPEFQDNLPINAPPHLAKKNYFLPPLLIYNLIAVPLTVFFIAVGQFVPIFVYLFLLVAIILDRKNAFEETSLSQNERLVSVTKGGLMKNHLLCRKTSIQSYKYTYAVSKKRRHLTKIRLYIKSVKHKSFNIHFIQGIED